MARSLFLIHMYFPGTVATFALKKYSAITTLSTYNGKKSVCIAVTVELVSEQNGPWLGALSI
jgi:hypothetical protein